MGKYKLATPIEVDGKTITEVTVRKPKGKDLIALGDHFAAIGRLGALGEDDAAIAASAMNRETFEAMVAFAAHLADLGDAAQELDFADLVAIMGEVAGDLGEAMGRGQPETGEKPSPEQPTS